MPKKKLVSKKIRLAIIGANGRMGQAIQQVLKEDSSWSEKLELVWTGSARLKSWEKGLKESKPELVIDFSSPDISLKVADLSAAEKYRALICSTGFTPAQKQKLRKYLGSKIRYLANTSLGVAAFKTSLTEISKSLPASYVFHVFESHHIAKKDSPSGTALALKDAILFGNPKRNVEIQSLRAGTEPGFHRVSVYGAYEKLELSHQAQDRKLFAIGALEQGMKILKDTAFEGLT